MDNSKDVIKLRKDQNLMFGFLVLLFFITCLGILFLYMQLKQTQKEVTYLRYQQTQKAGYSNTNVGRTNALRGNIKRYDPRTSNMKPIPKAGIRGPGKIKPGIRRVENSELSPAEIKAINDTAKKEQKED